MPKSKLILTGDIFRPFLVNNRWESATWKNVRWLNGIIGSAASLAGWEVSTVSWDPALTRDHQDVDVREIYDAVKLPLNVEGWCGLISQPALPASIESRLLSLFGADLVVGYEMPEHLLRLLNRAGIAVIDVVLHPVRFLDDIIFALRTNRQDIHARLLRHEIQRNEMVRQAGFIKAKAAWMKPPLSLSPGALLLLGQVDTDRAAVDTSTGRLRNLADHAEGLLELIVRSSTTLFRPHPYQPTDSKSFALVKRLQSVRLTNANYYHLLSQNEIETVCALNSSGLVEAELFGKEAVWLAPPCYRFGTDQPEETGYGAAVAQDGAWYTPAFWEAVRLKTGLSEEHPVPLTPNRLRRSLNADWAFSTIDKVVA
ncbi:conserved hypothetical protein [uncultured Pleomorphomonas sp.]|uniref:Capsule polysaccharide biosynthesis protein n=1 Tax=uncultured Pleomorphomonas sp. TaxID=442121 RepID=A0A212L9Q9_9HYPH|nr:hypothetical protein [uncultured Pleomorphomonas sp.]SCM74312.1 conserved hypothetical protein [uncultured Pleomorphomonas sp.]